MRLHRRYVVGVLAPLLLTGVSGVVTAAPASAVTALVPQIGTELGDYHDGFALSDVDGDGRLDQVVGTYGPNDGPFVLFGRGDGTFAGPVEVGLDLNVRFAVGDLNGDGVGDIVDTTDTTVTVALARPGTRTFSSRSFPAPSQQLYGLAAPVLADLDADGDLDVVRWTVLTGAVEVLTNDGTGALSATRSFPTGDSGPDALVAADLTSDGRTDVVVSMQGPDPRIVLLRGRPDGGLGAPETISSGLTASDLTVGDLDNDGRPDLVLPLFDLVTTVVLLNKGDGRFAAPLRQSRYESIAVADFDADGRNDVLTTAPGLRSGLGGGALSGDLYLLTERIEEGAAGDVDGDGDLDAVVLVDDETVVLRNENLRPFAVVLDDPLNTLTLRETDLVEVGDVDGDGDTDVLAGSTGSRALAVLHNDGAGNLVRRQRIDGDYTERLSVLAVGDLNADGRDDLVAGYSMPAEQRIFLATAAGEMVLHSVFPVSGLTTLADLDGDDDLDLVLQNGAGIFVAAGRGDGTFADAVQVPAPERLENLNVADLDGDGAQDLAALGPWPDRRIVVRYGDGTGSFPRLVRYAAGPYPQNLEAGDVDGDGIDDLTTSGAVHLGGPGGLGAAVPIGLAGGLPVDLDGDGRAEQIYVGVSAVGIGRNVDGVHVAAPEYFPADVSPIAVAFGDLDADGLTDVVVANQGMDKSMLSQVSVLLNRTLVQPAPDLALPGYDSFYLDVLRGGTFTVSSTTANVGREAAPRSRTRFYLSIDNFRSDGDIQLGGFRAVPALGPGAAFRGDAVLTVPVDVPPYYAQVLACADADGAVTENDEGDNCRRVGGLNLGP